MVYSDIPPYDVLKTADVTFGEVQKMKRFARFWDLLYNSGNFTQSVRLIWSEGSVYEGFLEFSGWMYTATQSTWKISLERLAKLLFDYLTQHVHIAESVVARAMLEDLNKIEGRTIPPYLRAYATENTGGSKTHVLSGGNRRQQRHG